ncbi:hypothetical protein HETIRDRAFT_378805 [Heterobasidion irregulare TC 32-1]|uniref:Uncharacterized protein n=1 Tax=Heterobasidion irregulare (strain TC 32-1) TaxID=747525 RepID=W4KP91_HETIT|nr:uncharacterized protein HETIRDRAFT_378805 [Heterobasidion irregulare TC 32-1]ETW87663.1 hypothetical protein HETIRDRAFT_378805 [Heterobasidion irregulare TC 32-1]
MWMWTDRLASAGRTFFLSVTLFCGFSRLALMLLGFVRTSSRLSSLARPSVRSPCWGVCRDMHLLFAFDRGRTLYFVPPPLQLLGFGLGFALDLGRLASFASGFVNSPFHPSVRPSGGFFFPSRLLARSCRTLEYSSSSLDIFSCLFGFGFGFVSDLSRRASDLDRLPPLFFSSSLYVRLDAMALSLPV